MDGYDWGLQAKEGDEVLEAYGEKTLLSSGFAVIGCPKGKP